MPYVARRSEPRTAVGAVAEPGQTGAKRARPAGRTRLVRLRREAGWVLAHKGLELILSILTLKVLTTVMRDDPAAYGEFNLALTGTVLLANVTLVPANQAYLRYYHTAAAHGAARGAAIIVVRWYAWATGAVALACGAFSVPIARAFGLEPWTLLATGLVFLTNRWRTLGIEILEVARARRQSTLRNLGFLALQLVAVAGAASLHAAKATAALLAYAFAAGVFAYTTLAPWLRSIQGTPDRAPSGLGHLIVTYGVPAAVLLQCQWVQSFADRYILGTWTDLDAVGRYVAAYQVCGVPYMLLMGTLYALFVPIAYERAQNVGDAQQVWAGDRVILASVVVYALVGGLGLAVFLRWGGPILRFFTAAQFSVPWSILVLLALARYLQNLSALLQCFFAVHQKMATSLAFRAVGAAVTVPLCWVAVQHYGMAGAAFGSAVAAGMYGVIVTFGPGGCFAMVWESRQRVRLRVTPPMPAAEIGGRS